MDNLELYNRFAQPPENALKPFDKGRFSGTDINPMWRIKALTEAFGACGQGWYTDIVRMWREDTEDGTSTVYCHIKLVYRTADGWSAPVTGIGGNTLRRKTQSGSATTDEAYKMAYTDAVGIACKALGIGANIWWQEAQSKYTATNQPKQQPTVTNQPKQQPPVTKSETVAPKTYNPMPEVEAIKARFRIDTDGFQQLRQSLIDGGIVQDIPSKSMTEADWKQLFRAIEANFGDVA